MGCSTDYCPGLTDMEKLLGLLLLLLGVVFVSSFAVLVALCRYKILRRGLRLRPSHTRIRLVEKQPTKTDRLDERCKELVGLCGSLYLPAWRISEGDLHDLRRIVDLARSITESDLGTPICDDTARLLIQASKTMARVEERLKDVEEISTPDNTVDMIQI
ncbi:uncharacterized protein LOC106670785 [Cimex lectularius]|uniref:Transmembrane protein 98 n=1 Tax=Cimex lectularius TaxID=79782 RepID=A0A8I6S671_CIMLE|nr:uncharacterized protein LOC106670785 [Cimex lectularius]XP_014256862.1 uncharacterized protein LOC106670785 [Cimex lectularius]